MTLPQNPAPSVQVLGRTVTGAPIISFGAAAAASPLDLLVAAARQYAANPADAQAVHAVNQQRRRIAETILQTSAALLPQCLQTLTTPAAAALREAGFLYHPLGPAEVEFVSSLTSRLRAAADHNPVLNDPGSLNLLLAATLYRQAHHLPLPVTLDPIPDWLLEPYLRYLLAAPNVFMEVGEADQYLAYMTAWVDYLHKQVLAHPESSRWGSVRNLFTMLANFIPIYFNSTNVRSLYAQRGDLIEFTLRHAGWRLDHTFPPRPAERKKIRVGILAAHYNPAPETFAALAFYEHLGSDFEVFLYAHQLTGHRLEQHCRSSAAALKQLPAELPRQAEFIRADDLDILFLATNVTAVLNPICILGAHRLARHQTTSVGSVVTTGLRNMDSYLSGVLTEPAAAASSHYREQLLKLDGAAHCFTYGSEKNTATYRVTRAQLGVRPEQVLLASGANVFKVVPELRRTWARILAAVPEAVLMLYPYGPNWSNAYAKFLFTQQFHATLREHGVEPSRLLILDPTPTPNRDDIKEFLKLADLYLDSYPFGGSTSLIDPLEVGLPTVVWKGQFLRSAMAAAIIGELGLPELIAHDEASYIDLAVALAKNPDRRQGLRMAILERMHASPPPRFLDPQRYSVQCGNLLRNLLREKGIIT